MVELAPNYEPQSYEKKWYATWQQSGYFEADPDSGRPPFVILMPPPNVTSQLHMGHGTGYTFQDLLIRWKRMCGYNSCWIPGTDHAGIATQMMVEKELLTSEGKTRQDLGRDAFVERCQKWREKHGGMIYQQFHEIGFSADWSRAAYTMDPHLSQAVRHVFVELFEEGLIYRGERLVNWDPVLHTAISDDEVESKEVHSHLWHLRYPIDGEDRYLVVATTRPETMLGDTAVAVHPDDERYQSLIGKNVRLPLCDRLIPIVADEFVKSEFGTGAVKITPAHDPNDFEMGKRHNLPFIEIFNDDASMSDTVPERFRGMDRFVARKEILKAFKELELFDKEEAHKHTVPHSERSKAVVEPKLSKQWYVKMKGLAKPAADAARNGDLRFYPDAWKKTWLYWLDNIEDWCISRQLWWGHQIPIWYCDDCDQVTTGMEDPSQCSHCQSSKIRQDEDVLDTWFSSWLWPLSPLGWPHAKGESTKDLEAFYPSQVLVTAPEIIFLWVARMTIAGLKFKGKIPFQDVYFNATVCDKQGRKFSKTLGNGIDPLEVIHKHGADAVRFTAVSLAPLGGRVRMETGDFEHGARFVNKLWNAARMILKHVDEGQQLSPLASLKLGRSDQWLLTEISLTAEKVSQKFSQYRLNEAVEDIYHFIWGSLCDWGLEAAKSVLQDETSEGKATTLSVLVYALEGALRLAHPVIPFVTEEIWQKLPPHPDWERSDSIVIADYPQADKSPRFAAAADEWRAVQALVTGIRSARQQVGLSSRQELRGVIKCDAKLVDVFSDSEELIKQLASITDLTISADGARPEQSLAAVGRGWECYLPVAGLVDFDKERERLTQEIHRIGKIVAGLDKKLSNKNFVDRAPGDVVQQTKDQRDNLEGQLTSLNTNLKALQ